MTDRRVRGPCLNGEGARGRADTLSVLQQIRNTGIGGALPLQGRAEDPIYLGVGGADEEGSGL